jgi:hypothetical protein
MPRASWRGFLRLSLVSCPIYLSPATTRAKSIRLHQVWQPAPIDVAEDVWSDRDEGQQGSAPSARSSSQTIPALMETKAPPPPGSRFGRMIPQPARRSTSIRWSRDTNTPAANSSPSPPRS